ncbi:phage integrase family protein : Phage integrase family protein OS=Rhodopirellula maiorica SM1 GN=RMSM_03522 PE=4 SV=1: Phage_integrase [Gemmata massiliana]|uniref:Tyr recombinase domain-containing protein n=1 Tax=Gemmata massiliana TaxID=1210884 RepID=A0A6P2CTH6_9BACT|nr:tyrosine-type recombinase/integrase [Gemmata massiliana]VTR91686.1 phage integrase family protein : Phage integrase family protein OS=Rhodopirellula maiorica SM1 GN=RMSM_03522 PE=4 SV=1: Phage_integrase [Gemmata massiliana]
MSKKRKRGTRGKPWYRRGRDQWCITVGDKITTLVDDKGLPVRGRDNRTGAEKAWHEMAVMASVPDNGSENEVRSILELYLQDMERRKVTQKTITTYTGYFKSFLARFPELLVRELRPFHIHEWWQKSHPAWGNSTQNLSGSAFKAALRWASSAGKGGAIIPTNPLEGMPLPTMRKRSAEVVVSDEEFTELLRLIKSPRVRDILFVAWETGTRPVNLTRATKEHLTEDGNAFMFADWNTEEGSAVHKTFKATGRPLAVPLTDAAKEVVHRLADEHPEGPLFRTPTGLPWTDLRLANTVMHYAKQAGLKGRFTAYSCRHSRATALLEAGHTDTDVAAILGNTPGVIHRNYSHVAAKVNRLRDLLNRGRKPTET